MYLFRIIPVAVTLLLACAIAQADQKQQQLYRWVDKNGVVHYGDRIPPEYAEARKEVLNEHGVTMDVMRGKKTEAEKAEEERQAKLQAEREIQRRQDQALLATYLSVDEIIMHRDRRVELFKAQARVTELYLRNLQKRLESLQTMAQRYRPYSDDPNAELIDPALAADIADTKDTISRHQQNLEQYREKENNIVARFDGDITRFKALKGLN